MLLQDHYARYASWPRPRCFRSIAPNALAYQFDTACETAREPVGRFIRKSAENKGSPIPIPPAALQTVSHCHLKASKSLSTNPFMRLDSGTWLHNRPEKDVYRLLIDAY